MQPAQEQLQELLQIAMGALADIAVSKDVSLTLARRKARRIYNEISTALGVGEEDLIPEEGGE